MPNKLSAASCVTLLELFVEHKADMHEDTFDFVFDVLMDLLEAANNEKHRLVKNEAP